MACEVRDGITLVPCALLAAVRSEVRPPLCRLPLLVAGCCSLVTGWYLGGVLFGQSATDVTRMHTHMTHGVLQCWRGWLQEAGMWT